MAPGIFYTFALHLRACLCGRAAARLCIASLFEDHAMVHEDGIRVDVPALNFSDFLARNFRPEDTVVMRIDIEGAEYEVLKSMIVSGTARLVDYIDVEWHAMLSPSLHHLKQARVMRQSSCFWRDST